MQPRAISGQLLDVIIDGAPQLLGVRAMCAPSKDEVAAQPAELSEVRRNVGGRARLRGAVARGTRARPSAARFSAFVIALSKRDAGESQIIDYWWLGIARATASYVRKASSSVCAVDVPIVQLRFFPRSYSGAGSVLLCTSARPRRRCVGSLSVSVRRGPRAAELAEFRYLRWMEQSVGS